MASIGSLTSSTTSSIRGYGGLASGLDRDELIEGMTIGTRTKINQQEQKKQKIEWMQEAVRTISDKMISFHGKYTETLTSSSNIFSSVLWGRNKITTSGENSKYVSITGTASAADAMTIMGIKQKAQNATWSSSVELDEERALTSGKIKPNNDTYAALNGQTLNFSYEGKNYSIMIGGDEKKLQDGSEAAKIIQGLLDNQEIDGNKDDHLGDHIKVTFDELNKQFTIKADKTEGASDADASSETDSEKDIKLTGGTALNYMGIDSKEVNLMEGNATSSQSLNLTKKMADMIKNQTLTFSFNGKDATVQFNDESKLQDIAKTIQDQLNAEFGKDRISVVVNENQQLVMKTMVPGEDEVDTSSILKVTGGSDDALKALKLSRGQSNRENFDTKINKNTGLAQKTVNGEVRYGFNLNGQFIGVTKGSTVKDLMNEINKNKDLTGVTVSYQEASDKFTFTSSDKGASSVIDFSENEATVQNALEELFRLDLSETEVRGKDAIVAVKYAGSDDIVELRRDSNTFTVDGLTLSLKGTFGYDEYGDLEDEDDLTKAVEVNAEVDVDRVLSTIKSFVDDYNAIVDMVNKELTTKHDRDYDPLSSEQKSELSDSEVEKWEAKAKAGLLYGDSDLRNLSMDLRVVVSGGYLTKLQDIGISVSSNYSDNGKLSIDETKLRAMLETDPERVQHLFTSTEGGVDANGDKIYNGLATNLKAVMDKYVKTTGPMEDKGVLIRKAGSQSAAMSLTQNYYYDQLTNIEKLLDTLNDRLKTEQDRYISQFSSLETLINNMNSQSSYLSSMF